MNGHYIYGTPIIVDLFGLSAIRNVGYAHGCFNLSLKSLFFLSHAHEDHTVGLTSTWRFGDIYMSAKTAEIIIHERKVKKEYIKVLEIGESKAIQVTGRSETIVVTPIDARHCAGSVMFLFQGHFGNILYTGDMRFSDASMITSSEALSQCSVIHRLYLDNTYCTPAGQFPSRDVATAEVIDLIAGKPEHKIFIGITKLGKEDLLVSVALYFGVPVVVSNEAMALLQILNSIPNVFSTDPNASRIHAISQTQMKKRVSMRKANDLFIMPTARHMTCGVRNKSSMGIIYVSYSNHSSFKELLAFVAAVKPREIIPIVADSKERADMSVFNHLLDKRPIEQAFPVEQRMERAAAIEKPTKQACLSDISSGAIENVPKPNSLYTSRRNYATRVSEGTLNNSQDDHPYSKPFEDVGPQIVRYARTSSCETSPPVSAVTTNTSHRNVVGRKTIAGEAGSSSGGKKPNVVSNKPLLIKVAPYLNSTNDKQYYIFLSPSDSTTCQPDCAVGNSIPDPTVSAYAVVESTCGLTHSATKYNDVRSIGNYTISESSAADVVIESGVTDSALLKNSVNDPLSESCFMGIVESSMPDAVAESKCWPALAETGVAAIDVARVDPISECVSSVVYSRVVIADKEHITKTIDSDLQRLDKSDINEAGKTKDPSLDIEEEFCTDKSVPLNVTEKNVINDATYSTDKEHVEELQKHTNSSKRKRKNNAGDSVIINKANNADELTGVFGELHTRSNDNLHVATPGIEYVILADTREHSVNDRMSTRKAIRADWKRLEKIWKEKFANKDIDSNVKNDGIWEAGKENDEKDTLDEDFDVVPTKKSIISDWQELWTIFQKEHFAGHVFIK